MIRVVGLDLSLTATGVATEARVRVLRPRTKGAARLNWISCEVDTACVGADVVVVEGPSYGSEHSQQFSLGKLFGVIEVILFRRQVPLVEVSPKARAKFATGNGNANKDQVLAAAVRAGAEVDDNNAADAYWLRAMGLAHYEQRDAVLPEYRREALSKVQWPELRTEAKAS